MTTTIQETELRYPVGKFDFDAPIEESQYPTLIAQIAEAPGALRSAVAGLSRDHLETRYRPGGWTVKQVVHHVPDSHLNSYIRFKLALTENEPTIKPYDEAVWAQLIDARMAPAEASLQLLEALHDRWTLLLRSLSASDVQRRFHHPELGVVTIDQYIALYAWHGAHHAAHITSLRERIVC